MRISDWSSDVCSSDLHLADIRIVEHLADVPAAAWDALHDGRNPFVAHAFLDGLERHDCIREEWGWTARHLTLWEGDRLVAAAPGYRSEEHTSELQSLMRISYAVF